MICFICSNNKVSHVFYTIIHYNWNIKSYRSCKAYFCVCDFYNIFCFCKFYFFCS